MLDRLVCRKKNGAVEIVFVCGGNPEDTEYMGYIDTAERKIRAAVTPVATTWWHADDLQKSFGISRRELVSLVEIPSFKSLVLEACPDALKEDDL